MKGKHFLAALLILMGVIICESTMSSDVWGQAGYPNKPIEYICHSGAGGASDAFVRNVARFLQTEKIVHVPIVVVNKPGGSGAIAFGYAAQKAGNPYYLLNITNNIITTPLEKAKIPGYKDFSILAMLAIDQNAIAVRAESPFKSMKDVVEGAKKRAKEIRYGGTSIGSKDHLTMYLLQKAATCEFNFISFTAENETLAALLGGHVDVASFNPATIKGQVEANKIRILGMASAKRVAAMPEVPTLTEMGLPVVIFMPRGVVAPKGIPADAKLFLIEAFKRLVQAQVWKKYLADSVLDEGGLFGEEYEKYLSTETERLRSLMKELGLIK